MNTSQTFVILNLQFSNHQMSIIFNEKGIKDCRPPCVAQSFVNHNAVLYKIFVLGEDHYVVERPSLKNFYRSCKYSTWVPFN